MAENKKLSNSNSSVGSNNSVNRHPITFTLLKQSPVLKAPPKISVGTFSPIKTNTIRNELAVNTADLATSHLNKNTQQVIDNDDGDLLKELSLFEDMQETNEMMLSSNDLITNNQPIQQQQPPEPLYQLKSSHHESNKNLSTTSPKQWSDNIFNLQWSTKEATASRLKSFIENNTYVQYLFKKYLDLDLDKLKTTSSIIDAIPKILIILEAHLKLKLTLYAGNIGINGFNGLLETITGGDHAILMSVLNIIKPIAPYFAVAERARMSNFPLVEPPGIYEYAWRNKFDTAHKLQTAEDYIRYAEEVAEKKEQTANNELDLTEWTDKLETARRALLQNNGSLAPIIVPASITNKDATHNDTTITERSKNIQVDPIWTEYKSLAPVATMEMFAKSIYISIIPLPRLNNTGGAIKQELNNKPIKCFVTGIDIDYDKDPVNIYILYRSDSPPRLFITLATVSIAANTSISTIRNNNGYVNMSKLPFTIELSNSRQKQQKWVNMANVVKRSLNINEKSSDFKIKHNNIITTSPAIQNSSNITTTTTDFKIKSENSLASFDYKTIQKQEQQQEDIVTSNNNFINTPNKSIPGNLQQVTHPTSESIMTDVVMEKNGEITAPHQGPKNSSEKTKKKTKSSAPLSPSNQEHKQQISDNITVISTKVIPMDDELSLLDSDLSGGGGADSELPEVTPINVHSSNDKKVEPSHVIEIDGDNDEDDNNDKMEITSTDIAPQKHKHKKHRSKKHKKRSKDKLHKKHSHGKHKRQKLDNDQAEKNESVLSSDMLENNGVVNGIKAFFGSIDPAILADHKSKHSQPLLVTKKKKTSSRPKRDDSEDSDGEDITEKNCKGAYNPKLDNYEIDGFLAPDDESIEEASEDALDHPNEWKTEYDKKGRSKRLRSGVKKSNSLKGPYYNGIEDDEDDDDDSEFEGDGIADISDDEEAVAGIDDEVKFIRATKPSQVLNRMKFDNQNDIMILDITNSQVSNTLPKGSCIILGTPQANALKIFLNDPQQRNNLNQDTVKKALSAWRLLSIDNFNTPIKQFLGSFIQHSHTEIFNDLNLFLGSLIMSLEKITAVSKTDTVDNNIDEDTQFFLKRLRNNIIETDPSVFGFKFVEDSCKAITAIMARLDPKMKDKIRDPTQNPWLDPVLTTESILDKLINSTIGLILLVICEPVQMNTSFAASHILSMYK